MNVEGTTQRNFSNGTRPTSIVITLAGSASLPSPVGTVVGDLSAGPSVMSFANDLSGSPDCITMLRAKRMVMVALHLALTSATKIKALFAILKTIPARVGRMTSASKVDGAPLPSASQIAEVITKSLHLCADDGYERPAKIARKNNAATVGDPTDAIAKMEFVVGNLRRLLFNLSRAVVARNNNAAFPRVGRFGTVSSSQGVNLRRKVSFWSGPLAAQTACGPSAF